MPSTDDLFPVTGLSGQTLSAVSASASQLPAFPGAQYVEVAISVQPVLVSFDGSTPTAQRGTLLAKDVAPVVWSSDKASSAKFVGSGGTSLVYATPYARYKAEGVMPRSLSSVLVTLSSYPVPQV